MDQIATIRGFNRFYTLLVGALNNRFLGSDLSLAEARILFEVAHSSEPPVAAQIVAALNMDAGYVSRVLRRFEEQGLIERRQGAEDARRRPIALTAAGRRFQNDLDERQRNAVCGMLKHLKPGERDVLARSLATAQAILGGSQEEPPFAIRTFRAGDIGMIAARQSILYAEGWGWGRPMEVLQGEITTAFLRDFKPGREQCWVAERAGVMAGSVLLADAGENVGQLRLLYVEPWTRGLGIGAALVDECVSFAREAGYSTMRLWTHSVLTNARRIYEAAGFNLVDTSMHDAFGKPESGETWELALEG